MGHIVVPLRIVTVEGTVASVVSLPLRLTNSVPVVLVRLTVAKDELPSSRSAKGAAWSGSTPTPGLLISMIGNSGSRTGPEYAATLASQGVQDRTHILKFAIPPIDGDGAARSSA